MSRVPPAPALEGGGPRRAAGDPERLAGPGPWSSSPQQYLGLFFARSGGRGPWMSRASPPRAGRPSGRGIQPSGRHGANGSGGKSASRRIASASGAATRPAGRPGGPRGVGREAGVGGEPAAGLVAVAPPRVGDGQEGPVPRPAPAPELPDPRLQSADGLRGAAGAADAAPRVPRPPRPDREAPWPRRPRPGGPR